MHGAVRGPSEKPFAYSPYDLRTAQEEPALAPATIALNRGHLEPHNP